LCSIFRRARHEQRTVREEDELPAGLEHAVCLGEPVARIRPEAGSVFRYGQVEAPAVVRQLLDVRVHEPEGELVLALQLERRLQLAASEVDGRGTVAEAREPRCDGCRAASELDDVQALADTLQELELRLRKLPYAPTKFLVRPGPPADGDVVGSPGLPGRSIPRDVVGLDCRRVARKLGSVIEGATAPTDSGLDAPQPPHGEKLAGPGARV